MKQQTSRPILRPITRMGRSDASYPAAPNSVPTGSLETSRYTLRFARTQRELYAVQRLRFAVFNEELDEGLAASHLTGRDADPYDSYAHHLMVICNETRDIVGTYRLMTTESAAGRAFYSASEYGLSAMPKTVLVSGVEAGRACVAEAHRNGRVVQLLWRGIARYMAFNDKRFLFGCCSVPTLDAREVYRLSDALDETGQLDRTIRIRAREHVASARPPHIDDSESVLMPPLMASYLRLGARVVSEPAFDRAFGVTDFLVLLDLRNMPQRAHDNLMRTCAAWDRAQTPRSA